MIETIQSWDNAVFVWINQTAIADWLDSVMIFFSSKWAMIPAYLFLVLSFIRKFGKKSWIPVLFCVLAFGIADSFSSRVMKPVFQRKRPFLHQELHARLPDGPAGSRYGFVSSHSANMFAVLTLAGLMLGWKGGRMWALLSLSALIAYSRVYLGVHFPTDVIVGAFLGLLIALVLHALFRRWQILPVSS
ncbi:MAG: phosphatase PAP2 family protein [Bacteroidetes bacterium]|nr:phosphatase PAP2 family protein [Bacteroidota bacterium]